jgi:hypothetical protein
MLYVCPYTPVCPSPSKYPIRDEDVIPNRTVTGSRGYKRASLRDKAVADRRDDSVFNIALDTGGGQVDSRFRGVSVHWKSFKSVRIA